jgi:hypothetical protein
MNAPRSTLHCVPGDFPARRTRYLRFIELWEPRRWLLKVYLHSAHFDQHPSEYLEKAKIFIELQLSKAERIEPQHRVGFMILSHGAVSNWVMLDWWSSLNIYQKIFRVEGMPPRRFIEAPPDLFQCVYDLRITAFESEAWREYVVENPNPDLNAYLAAQLNVDVV